MGAGGTWPRARASRAESALHLFTRVDRPATSHRAWLLPLALLLALGTLRGGATSLAKYVSIHGVPAMGYALWQCAIASLLLLGACRLQGIRLPLDRAHRRHFLVCGAFGCALPNSLFFLVLGHIPAGSMAVILTTIPLITYALALLVRAEAPDLRRALGIGVGLAGAALVVLPGGGVPEPSLTPWLLLALLCPTLYAGNAVYAGRHRLRGSHPMALAGGTLGAAALCLLPVVLATGSFHPVWRDWSLPDLLVLAHGGIAAAAYSLFFLLLRLAGPVFYSQTAYVIALTGIGWGMLVFGERHPAAFWLAVALVFTGVLLVNSRQRAVRT